MNNVCIFALFQINGIKDYVFHNLNYLKNQLNCEIIAVSNTEISTEDCIKLNPFCKKIIVRKNKGRDFGAFKEGILSNFEEIKRADNLILINDTILGSFVNFKEDFITFTKKDCDFWGILERGHKKPLKSFICSFFLVFKSQILKSDCFKRFWKFYFSTNIKDLICQLGEKKLTRVFIKNGFKFDALISSSRIKEFLNTLSLDDLKKMAEKFNSNPKDIKKFKNFEKDGIIDFLTFEDPWKKVPELLIEKFKIPFIKNHILGRNFLSPEKLEDLLSKNLNGDELKIIKSYFNL